MGASFKQKSSLPGDDLGENPYQLRIGDSDGPIPITPAVKIQG
jgi:hypothetical protein